MSYFSNILRGIKTTKKGLSLTLKHLWAARNTKGNINVEHPDYFEINEGHVTLQYPHEEISIPEHGRYQLDCEIDDCIVCDKCAKVCPVDCIEIEAIKSPELIRNASDGSPVRLHAAKFDIDMAKCCFCGLCTTVCPTECLTMDSNFDYSVVDITKLNFAFANLTESEAQEKRDHYDQFVKEKEALKLSNIGNTNVSENVSSAPKTGFKPSFKPTTKPVDTSQNIDSKPIASFKPSIKPTTTIEENVSETLIDKPKPAFKPTFKPKVKSEVVKTEKPSDVEENVIAKPLFLPKLKPIVKEEIVKVEGDIEKPKFTPKLRPISKEESAKVETEKPKFIPKQKPKAVNEEPIAVEKPKFIPKLKPKS